MKIIADIKNGLKLLLGDLRRNLGLLLIIGIIWIVLLIGILFLKIYIGPMEAISSLSHYFSQSFIDFMTSVVKVAIAGVYAIMWLYLWNRMVRTYFWRDIQKYYGLPDEKKIEAPE
jgi:hypothetical protein